MSANKVLVGYDGTPGADHALGWALREARRLGTSAELVYALSQAAYVPAAFMVPGTVIWADHMAMQAVRDMLVEAVDKARAGYPDVPITALTDRGAAELVLRTRAADAALLVVGSHSHRAIAGLLLGSVAEAVTAHASCPVIVVREPVLPIDDRLVVLGLDESIHADTAIRFAFEQAATLGVPLRAVHAWIPPSDPWNTSPSVDREDAAVGERSWVSRLLDGWREKFPAVAVTAESVAGHPGRVLIESTLDAQLVVVGARGRGGLHDLLHGSVARHLLHHGSSTIAVIR
jgi:nucleotide-binding universal stress UspA family protein